MQAMSKAWRVFGPFLEDRHMLKLRTKVLLFAIAFFGIGIGVLSGLADGAYSAICLFLLPVLVALAGVSILRDFNTAGVRSTAKVIDFNAPAVKKPLTDDASLPVWMRNPATEEHHEWTN